MGNRSKYKNPRPNGFSLNDLVNGLKSAGWRIEMNVGPDVESETGLLWSVQVRRGKEPARVSQGKSLRMALEDIISKVSEPATETEASELETSEPDQAATDVG